MCNVTCAHRVVGSDENHPLMILINDADSTSLRFRAREFCDDSWPHWSRSYSGVTALVAGWHHRVGLDFEFLDRVNEPTWSIEHGYFRSSMMTSEERETWSVGTTLDARASATSVWCSKEALAKALGTPQELNPARLTGPTTWSNAGRGCWRARFLDTHSLGCDAVAWVVFEVPPS